MAGFNIDPGTAALLGMGSGLLAATGPSKRPVSLGQAMGYGTEGMLSAYNQAQAAETQKVQRELKMRELQAYEAQQRQAQQQQQQLMEIADQVEPYLPGFKLMAQMDPKQAIEVLRQQLYPKPEGLQKIEKMTPSGPVTTFVRPKADAEYPMIPKDPGNMQRAELPVPGSKGLFQLWSMDPRTQQPVAKIGEPFEKTPLAQATAIAGKGESAFATELGKKQADQFSEQSKLAGDAQASLAGIQEAQKLLNSGMITGFGADFRVGLGKALQQIGVRYNDDAIANSEAFTAAQAKQVAQIIKAFGAGTGLSDADREFAIKAAAGSIEMNEASIRRILDINERAFRNVIKVYNKRHGELPKELQTLSPVIDEPAKQVKRRGVYQGRPVVEYTDGSVEFADGK